MGGSGPDEDTVGRVLAGVVPLGVELDQAGGERDGQLDVQFLAKQARNGGAFVWLAQLDYLRATGFEARPVKVPR